MIASPLSSDLLSRTLDVLERLPTPMPPVAPGVTAEHLRESVQAHCEREGLTVDTSEVDKAIEAHLNAHPLVKVSPAPPPVLAPEVIPVRIGSPRGWRRPRTPFTRWLRQHGPGAAWRALTHRLKQGRTSDTLFYTYTLAFFLWAPTWFFSMPMDIRMFSGMIILGIATMTGGIEDTMVARHMGRMGHRLSPVLSDPLEAADGLREQDLVRWQDTPEALAHVQACLHSRIPCLLVGDVRYIQHLRQTQQQQRTLTQQQAQVAQALQKAQRTT